MNPQWKTPLTRVEQIELSVASAIEHGASAPGMRLPSIRKQATLLGVSPFTVAEAYDRLVARGMIESRRGSGFFVRSRTPRQIPGAPLMTELPVDEHWLLRNVYNQPDQGLPAGCGWLPPDWYDREAQQRALRAVARLAAPSAEYGDPRGFRGLRTWLAHTLSDKGILLNEQEILLTQGASSALHIASACLARPGETVFVDDPGYCNILSNLAFHGIQVVGVPWTSEGPDTAAMAELLKRHRPKAFITNPWLQNPTGASYTTQTAHQVLTLAEQHDFYVVEDNVSAELADWPQPTLAAMDGLARVIYIGSFSKSLSPALRVGYLAARGPLHEQMTRFKMMTGMTSPELNERIILAMLQESRQRRYLERLRNRLSQAQFRCADQFAAIGWQVFTRPSNGLFLLARPTVPHDSLALTRSARAAGFLLAPGNLFRPGSEVSPWLRFNVAFCQDTSLWDFLRTFNL
ncbi:GntR family transcriptional regulator [Paludibacterium purpuratum]|uniref:Putative 8-amino-7-oxononanoate synthase n=2 Tax=Paludibacterium purpuratum TaxID=1144873 RepID=A0A4R7B8Q4_9NEIS|nr:GntR family transcriptional regulator [Paludibacterium purpuratum]